MSLKQQLTDDMKTAMKAGEKDRLAVIRLINAAIKQKEVDERVEMTDPLVLAVLEKMVKQRKDSITQYEAAAREDLAADLEGMGLRAAFGTARGAAAAPGLARWSLPRNNVDRRVACEPGLWPWLLMRAR